ncbi:MAG: type II toxin-antitoxin system VapC family toxin [Bryobacteraceae bacterium]
MNEIVVDASITLSWCFPDEQTPSSLAVLDRLKAGDSAVVPAFWPVEVLNSLLVGERRGRISPEQTQTFLRSIQALRPTLDNASLDQVIGPVQKLCRDHRLAPYDALYVDLAMRKKCPFATLDQPQRDAAMELGIHCL